MVESTTTFSWRKILTPSCISPRRFSSSEVIGHKKSVLDESGHKASLDGSSGAMQKTDGTADPTASPSEDETGSPNVGNVDPRKVTRHMTDSPSDALPETNKSLRPSLLFRMLQSSKRRQKSQLSASGGSTASRTASEDEMFEPSGMESPSREVRRATMDNVMNAHTDGASNSHSLGPLGASEPLHPNSSPQTEQAMGRDGGMRRATSMDDVHKPRSRRFATNVMSQAEYEDAQERLQRQADDHAKGGQREEAIGVWRKALQLAEEQQASLTSKTELMCAILDLHMQLALANPEDSDLQPEVFERRTLYHKHAAKRCLQRIKPALVKPTWWVATHEVMELMIEANAWELALQTAEQLVKENGGKVATTADEGVPTIDRMAVINYELARKKLSSRRKGEALQYLQAASKYMQQHKQLSLKEREMYADVLRLLASEYSKQGQYALALKAFHEQLRLTNSNEQDKQAFLHCQIATEVYIPSLQLDLALEHVQKAMSLVKYQYKQNHQNSDKSLHLDKLDVQKEGESTHRIHLQVLQVKAEVLYKQGQLEQALSTYEKALKYLEVITNVTASGASPMTSFAAEKAKVLFSMGRVCVKLGRIRQGIFYFSLELEITHAELGDHLSVSRVLHELAKLFDEGLGDYRMALQKYREAFRVEYAVMQQCASAIESCPKCSKNRKANRTAKGIQPACTLHSNLQRDCAQQMRETKKCEGRILFKLGDFERALQTTLPRHAGTRLSLEQQ